MSHVESESVVRVDRAETGVTTITLDRPKVNAVSPELIQELLDTVDRLATEPDARAILLKGANGRFCAGADIDVMSDHSRETYRVMRRWIDVEDALERMGKPVVCAIERFALGGGAEIALACDVRVMGRGAVFGFPEVDLGLFPGAGGTQRLTRLVGVSRAFWLLATGKRLSAEEALAEGIATEVVDDDQVVPRATEIAEQLAQGPTRAIGLIKSLVYEAWGRELPAGLEREGDAVFELLTTEDLKEGFAAFHEKRSARFTGR
jgi:enoyl-CoA hydratase